MPNLKFIALSAYKSNGYIHKYIFGPPKFKYANSKHMHMHSHTDSPTRPYTCTHLDTHRHFRAG